MRGSYIFYILIFCLAALCGFLQCSFLQTYSLLIALALVWFMSFLYTTVFTKNIRLMDLFLKYEQKNVLYKYIYAEKHATLQEQTQILTQILKKYNKGDVHHTFKFTQLIETTQYELAQYEINAMKKLPEKHYMQASLNIYKRLPWETTHLKPWMIETCHALESACSQNLEAFDTHTKKARHLSRGLQHYILTAIFQKWHTKYFMH